MIRSRVWLPFAILVALFGAYSIYWNVVRGEAEKIVEREIEAWRAAGYTVDWSDQSVGGYPFRVTMTFEAPAMASAPGEAAWSWRGERLRVHALPYQLNHVILEPEGDFLADSEDTGPLQIQAEEALISVVSDAQGVSRIGVSAVRASARRGVGGVVAAEADELRVNAFRDPDDPARYHVAAVAAEPHWEGAGADAPSAARADVTLERADVFAAFTTIDDRALAAWADAQGRLRVNAAEVMWGEAGVSVDGLVGLETSGHWSGDLRLTARRPSETFMRLSRLGAMDRQTAQQAGLLADAAAGGDGGSATAPIRIRSGEVAIYGIRVGYIDRAF